MALQIFLKYGNPDYPTHCEHDELIVMIEPSLVSHDDTETLSSLGFLPNISDHVFHSYRYGSA